MATQSAKEATGEGIKAYGLSHKEIIQLARKMYSSGAANAQPLFLAGPPGAGKTDSVKKLAELLFQDVVANRGSRSDLASLTVTKRKKTSAADPTEVTVYANDVCEFPCIVISAPLLDPIDVKGVPAIDLERQVAYWIKPYFLPKKGPGLILIDDITAASKSVVASLLMLVQHRRVLEYVLPDDIMIIAAGNRVEDASDCNQLSAAMRSRMTHINFVPDFDEWVEWAFAHDIHPSVIGFLRWKGGDQYFNTKESELHDGPFPCPRTWEHASNIIGLKMPRKIMREAIMGCVGLAAGNEYMMYSDMYQELPKIEDIMKSPEDAPVPKTMDGLYAVATAVAAQAKHDQHHKSIIKYAMRLPEEFQILTIGDAIRQNYAIVLAGDRLKDGKIDYAGYITEFVKKHERVLTNHKKLSKDNS